MNFINPKRTSDFNSFDDFLTYIYEKYGKTLQINIFRYNSKKLFVLLCIPAYWV